jgi:hypothetical protein
LNRRKTNNVAIILEVGVVTLYSVVANVIVADLRASVFSHFLIFQAKDITHQETSEKASLQNLAAALFSGIEPAATVLSQSAEVCECCLLLGHYTCESDNRHVCYKSIFFRREFFCGEE